jgi:hypothetical protein
MSALSPLLESWRTRDRFPLMPVTKERTALKGNWLIKINARLIVLLSHGVGRA